MKSAMPMHGYAFRFSVAHAYYEKLATGTYGGPDACFPPYLWRLPFFYLDVLCYGKFDLLATAGDLPLSWTSPIYPKLYSNDTSINPLGKPITEHQDGWIGSLVTIGAIVGPLPFGFISEKFGRKIGLLSIALPHIISYFMMAFAKHIYMFYIGRILGGLAMGGGYTLLPMYIAEISQNSNRGMMSQTLNVFWAIGNFLPYALGPFLSIMWFNIVLACIPSIFFLSFLAIGPESPYYLVKVNKIKEAEKALMLLRSLDEKGVEVGTGSN
ncbi:hypothetical protein NQ318_002666 [Aromia moschata]|uniref:Major facilitator superfamily (MFS) profile domain-containing protein n=1 Tax=Aromia moschata TaxID=1265417 RepID=A0AAV8XVH6_9CUCU|nr:hypothetical protein NQ318_002666 [Aromia moschata]